MCLVVAMTACQSPTKGKEAPTGTAQDPVATCTKDGQTCEYSDGKLGLCTQKMTGCDGGICFTCMSLH